MRTEAQRMARLVWQYGEPIHAVAFFAPEASCGFVGGPIGWLIVDEERMHPGSGSDDELGDEMADQHEFVAQVDDAAGGSPSRRLTTSHVSAPIASALTSVRV
jgi:hypothetical protein